MMMIEGNPALGFFYILGCALAVLAAWACWCILKAGLRWFAKEVARAMSE